MFDPSWIEAIAGAIVIVGTLSAIFAILASLVGTIERATKKELRDDWDIRE